MAEARAAVAALFSLADGVVQGESGQRRPNRPSDIDLFSRAKALIEAPLSANASSVDREAAIRP